MTSASRGLLPIALLLAAVTAAVYARVVTHEFVAYDDEAYIVGNPDLAKGSSLDTVAWAFGCTREGNWHPLTWLSHALDYRWFGARPAGHHAVNVALHAVNAAALFLVLAGMTGARWRSAFVAALFALHPLHVESVAWAAERKDVLSTLFWILALGAHARWARRGGAPAYLAVAALLTLGLLAKPMLVTVPFVLLLLDFWPLGRLAPGGRRVAGVWVEKIPLLALAAASAVVTFVVQRGQGAMTPGAVLPLAARIANAVVAYGTYLVRTVWPVDLAVLYPLPREIASGKVVGAAILLIVISAGVARLARRAPYLVVAWLWYLGTLVPVIGLVQVGVQATADRYTYMPLVGVFLGAAWGVPDLLTGRRHRRTALGALAAAVLLACVVLTSRQIAYWKDSARLFEHALEVTEDNHVMHNNLGGVLFRQGRTEEAIRHFSEARRIWPDYPEAISNLGVAIEAQGRVAEAMALYREALERDPSRLEAWFNLGNAQEKAGNIDEAIAAFRQALRRSPDHPEISARLRSALERREAGAGPALPAGAQERFARANALRDDGRLEEAAAEYRALVTVAPDHAGIRNNLGSVLGRLGRHEEAVAELSKALELNPDLAAARSNLGILLALRGDVAGAARQFTEALRLEPRDPSAHYNLGRLLAGQGRWEEAISHYQEALRLAPGHPGAAAALEQARRRKREAGPGPSPGGFDPGGRGPHR